MLKRIQHIIFILFVFSYTSVYSQSVVINEVMYSNTNAFFDSFEKTPDWIELYNSSNSPVNLKNWKLTDDISNDSYWNFPDTTIQPHAFLIVFASGKNGVFNAEIHTNFKLKHIGETLSLLNSQNQIQSSVPSKCAPTNFTRGAVPDGSSNFYTLYPTPGTSNNSADSVVINYSQTELYVDHQAGFYTNEFNLHINAKNNNAFIYYTTNGEEPNEKSQLYSNSILIRDRTKDTAVFSKIRTSDSWQEPQTEFVKCTPIRAIAYIDGCPASPIVTKSYFVNEAILNKFSVPVVSLVTEPDNLFDKETGIYVKGNYENYFRRGSAWEREAHFEYFTNDTLAYTQNLGIRIHGGYSRQKAQKTLRLISKEKYGQAQFNYAFFNEKPHVTNPEKLLLRTVRDWSHSLIKDPLAHDLVKDMNMFNMASQVVVVFINGEYWGIHVIREYQDENYIHSNFSTSDSVFDILTHARGKYPTLVQGSYQNYNELVDYFNNNDLTLNKHYEYVSTQIDIPNLIDYYISEIYFANQDFPDNNLKMWRASNSDTAKWRYFFYDCDECMSRVDFNAFLTYTDNVPSHQLHNEYTTFILSNLFKNAQFRQQFTQRYFYVLNNALNPAHVLERIEYFKNIYKPLVAEHSLRWRFFEDPVVWENSLEMLRKYAMERPLVVSSQLLQQFGSPFIAFPNPTTQNTGIYISCSSHIENCETVFLELLNMNGQVIFSQPTTTCALNDYHIASVLQSGSYILRITYNNSVFSSQIMVN